MGNTHIFYHRLPALSTAVLASIAYSFVLVAGTTCDFINVLANPGSFLEYVTDEGITVDITETKLGLLCETPPFFVRGTDQLWSMSLYFWIASSVVGALGVSLSWALTIFLGPTDLNWKVLSFLAGVSAILQSPMYVIFASEPCKENVCTMSTGCVMLSISTIFWVTLTILTQCQDPPMWANELNAWRVQKERQEGMARQPQLESRWGRWIKRRKWATGLGLAATDSESVNDVSRMELLENGSYYADSNNSRLMLKVMPDGKRPDDDNKSVGTFGDLEDMVQYAEEQRTFAQLEPLPSELLDDENDPHNTSGDGMPIQQPRELLTIHSHTDAPPVLDTGEEKAFLLGDGESPNAPCMQPPRQIIITGIRSLAERMKRETTRNKSRYSHLDDDGDSDADVEDEIDGLPEDFTSPMSPQDLSKLCQEETPSPPGAKDSRSQVLLHDWNALHAAANAGILLPTTISIADTVEDPEPKIYRAEDSASEISLASYGDFPDDEEVDGGVSGSSVSSDSSNDESPRKHRRHRRRVRRAYSATNSVGSRTSLLDLTIEEETAGDLQEMGSSGDERKVKKSLSQDYTFRGVKSAPDRLGFALTETKESGVNQSDSGNLLRLELDCVSEDSDSHVSDILGKAGEATGEFQVDNSEESTELSSSIGSTKDMTLDQPQVTPPQRGRGMSVPRRKRSSVHPLSPTPTPRGKSAAARFRAERVDKAGIHSPHINVVSDDSSASEDSLADRSFRSTVSRRARKARVRRMHEDTVRRRARTVAPSNKRRAPPKPEVIIFDPTLRAILVSRDPGKEYGPDEASL